MCCGPGLLLCCHSGQLQLIWFCPGHLSRTSLSGRLPLFCSLTKTCEWLGGYPWALHSLQGHRGLFMCDKYTYFSLNRLCDRSLALAFHHPWGSLQETEGLLPGCGFKMSALGTVVPLPTPAAPGVCEAHKHQRQELCGGMLPGRGKPEISELVGCAAEHIQTFVHHVSPRLAG